MISSAVLAGGCFWCLEASYNEIAGIERVQPGYAGGHTTNPTYKQVCTGTTGHAEVVRLDYDPAVISYADLLRIFFTIHDPTTLNQQGGDIGTQYRSAIFYSTEAEKAEAETIIAEFIPVWGKIVTELVKLEMFWPAEAEHKNYFTLNPESGYCQAVIAPKILKLRKAFRERLKQPS